MSAYDKDLPKTPGIYHKFINDVTYRFRIASDPILYTSTFKGKENTGYVWLAYNVDDKIAQLLKLPKGGAQQIWALAREHGDPTGYGISIVRTGSGFDTEYKVEASPKKLPLAELPDDIIDALAQVDPIESLKKGNGFVDAYYMTEDKDGEVKSRAESQPAPVVTPAPKKEDEEPW